MRQGWRHYRFGLFKMSSPSADWILFAKAIETMTAGIRNTYEIPVKDGAFLENTWTKFDLHYNLEVLMSKKQSYLALREATFAAFCSWMIAPDDNYIRQSSIVAAIAKKLCDSESNILRETNQTRFALDALTRITSIGPDFYEQIYYPIGGLSAMLQCPSPKEMGLIYTKKRKDVARVLFMTGCMHYISDHCSNLKIYNAPSKSLIVKALQEVGHINGAPLATSDWTGRSIWDKYIPSMLLLYTASIVEIENQSKQEVKTFVETILSGEADYERDIEFVSEIIGRARFLKENIGHTVSKTVQHIFDAFDNPAVDPIETKYIGDINGVDVLQRVFVRKLKKNRT